MPFENIPAKPAHVPPSFTIGQEVIDKEGKNLGKVRARFSRYILVERGGLFVKAYYVPHSAINEIIKGTIHLAQTEDGLREHGYNHVPDDLYEESPEYGQPDITGVAQFARGPLSPAETGHYNYGSKSPGINTDASGSYHREDVLPIPQRTVGERRRIYTTNKPIPPRETSPDF